MRTDAITHIKTDDLPMPTARGDRWRIMAEQPTAAIKESYAITDRSLGESVLKNLSLFSSRDAFDVLSSSEAQLRQQAIELIEPIVERGSCDFVAEVTRVFPSEVFLTLFRLPLDKRDQLLDWKDAVESLAGARVQITADDKSRRPSSRTGTRSCEELQ
jgi:hypothetical protein